MRQCGGWRSFDGACGCLGLIHLLYLVRRYVVGDVRVDIDVFLAMIDLLGHVPLPPVTE
jgi:hypothetical protein